MRSPNVSPIFLLLCACVSRLTLGTNAHASQRSDQQVGVSAGTGNFNPQIPQKISVAAKGVSVVIESGRPFVVRVERNDKKLAINLPDEIAQVSTARLFGTSLLVVSSMISGNASEVAVVDLEHLIIKDTFLCYAPVVAPNGRYIVFIKFFPAHGISSAENHYMLYDVTLSPAANRPQDQKPHPALVGRVLYPQGMQNRVADNIDIVERPPHQIASETFFWSAASDELLFLDRLKDDYTLVAVHFQANSLDVWLASIPGRMICPPRAPSCFEVLSSVTFGDSPGVPIRLELRGVMGTPGPGVVALLMDLNSPTMSVSLVP